jgi:hypothetical protein
MAREMRECPKPVFPSNRMRPVPVTHPHMSVLRDWNGLSVRCLRGVVRSSRSFGLM